MALELRVPIGLLFGALGVLLAGYGVVSDPGIYEKSLGINVNLAWGGVILAFGVVMLGLAWRARGASAPSSTVRE